MTDKKLKRWRFYLQHIDCFWRRNGNIYIRTDNIQVNKSERVIFTKQNRFITRYKRGKRLPCVPVWNYANAAGSF